jgi:membrane-anchored protein YejM (alkaline phosphatase superfamily)
MSSRLILFFLFLPLWNVLHSQNLQTENVFIITLDGLRWEEVFQGTIDSMMTDPDFVDNVQELKDRFDAPTATERRAKLMPWFWNTLAKTGQLYGNRAYDNKVNCSNSEWFSYPGYNEILCGFVDPAIQSNDKVWNTNKTVLEWFNDLPEYNSRVAAFASWDVFPYIINEKRSGIPVNAGFRLAKGKNLSEKEHFLNELQPTVPSPWSSVRLDAFTHHYCLEYLKRKHPKLVYLSYGETDDFAHDGEYDQYLKSAYQTDQWIKELWEYVQSDPVYAGKTTFIITTDHGRGNSPKGRWVGHGQGWEGSDAIWLAILGPDTPALGEMTSSGQLWQNQLAKTAAAFLGKEYSNGSKKVGEIIEKAIR